MILLPKEKHMPTWMNMLERVQPGSVGYSNVNRLCTVEETILWQW
jgi:hypothetical protein